MKFRAYIPYTLALAREAKRFNDLNVAGQVIEFTFADIVGRYIKIDNKEVFFGPDFTARELIIPWLKEGNIPEIVKEKPDET